MVVQLLTITCDLEGVRSFSVPDSHEWTLDIVIGHDEVRENIKLCRNDCVDIPNSRGIANIVLNIERGRYATISVEQIRDIVRTDISSDDSGRDVPLLAVECRGCTISAWKPTGFYTVVTESGSVFDEVDLSEKEWYDVDPETNEPISITNVRTSIETYRK
jgi:hypothetical protein